ncbi:MAG: redoxin domain-containing protein [Planctomycetales bacterium]|nr:redoxin domain-containing protein [Planctomycetales bacterium]
MRPRLLVLVPVLVLVLGAGAGGQDPAPPAAPPQALEIPRTPEEVRNEERLAEACLRAEKYAEASGHWDKVLLAKPGHLTGLYFRATCRVALLRWEEAEADLTAALEKKPDWQPARGLRAQVRLLRGHWDGALADFDSALADRVGPGGKPVKPDPQLAAWRDQAVALRDAERRLRPGLPAPDARFLSPDGVEVRLSSFRGKSAVVLVFHRGFGGEEGASGRAGDPKSADLSAASMAHLSSLREHHPALTARGAVVLAASRDTPIENRTLKSEKGLPYECLSDLDGEATAAFGVEDMAHAGAEGRSLLALVVVDKDGRLREREVFPFPGKFADLEALAKRLEEVTGVKPPAEDASKKDGGGR